VPLADRCAHVEPLACDDGGEADAHHVELAVAEEQYREDDYHAALVGWLPDPDHPAFERQVATQEKILVQDGLVDCLLGVHVFVQDHRQNRQSCEDGGEPDHELAVLETDRRVEEGQTETHLHECNQHAPMYDELGQGRGALLAVAAVPK